MKLIIPTIRSENDDKQVYSVDFNQAETLTLYNRNLEILAHLELSEIKSKTLVEKLNSFIMTNELHMNFVSNQQTKVDKVSKLLETTT